MNKIFVKYHLRKYPNMTKQDIIKLIYQETMGPTHIINHMDLNKIKSYILEELNKPKNPNENLYEYIGSNYIRMNIHTYQKYQLDFDLFLDMFIKSNNEFINNDLLIKNLNQYFESSDLKDYDYTPVHHSMIYNEQYLPHYRIIKSSYLTLQHKEIQIRNYLKNLKKHMIVSIEGRCCSGKTTLSKTLESDYTVIHVDDFFLPIKKKTVERLDEIGGNIDYELIKLTLSNLKKAISLNQKEFTYQAYDCSQEIYYDKTILLKDLIILEGVYSTHPYFRDLIDKIIYLYVDKNTQLERVNQRKLKDRFIKEWIPLEEKYYENIDIESICDLVV
ncbi:MAG: hypothetical protein IKC22_06390 [Bacilli bacterium]|nr:hypothetical protein [Bacilli bacterium]